MECLAREAGQIKIKIETDDRVNDEKLSPCLPFYCPCCLISTKKEWESERRSPIIQVALAFLPLAVACCPQNHHLPCVQFACRVNKAWLIMAVSVIFQSHIFSLVNMLLIGHVFNVTSIFRLLFELGNSRPYRLT